MRRAAIVFAAVLFSISALAARRPGSVHGTVELENGPLPGATVRLLVGDEEVAHTVTNANGYYAITNAPGGWYDLEASLSGLVSASQVVVIDGNSVPAEPMTLELRVFEEPIVLSCGSPCDGEGLPTCDEYDENRDLESKALLDRSALERLEERYRRTPSREERARIAGFLIGILDEDDEFAEPLLSSAETLISFGEHAEGSLSEDQPDYLAWCNANERDPAHELWLLYSETSALLGSIDSRAIAYAHRALRTHDWGLKGYAFRLAGLTCEPSLLKAVGEELDGGVEECDLYAFFLVMPCGDPSLNERITAIDPDFVNREMPGIIEARTAELSRLRLLSP
jgi:hypothetical protein